MQEHFNDLVVATYGRGFWILDDLTPLQQLTSDVLAKSTHLMAPRPAYRFLSVTEPMMDGDDPTQGVNPPYGASIDYYLKEATEAKVELVVKNAQGELVRTLEGTKEAGINRLWWDLRYEPSKEIRLRTKPLYAPYVEMGPEGFRAYQSFGGSIRILAPPGTYTVTLRVGDEELTESLQVLQDPSSEGTLGDIDTQVTRLLTLRENMNTVVEMINRVEWTRKQLYDLREVHQANERVHGAIDELDKKLIDVEENLHQMRMTGRGQDALRWPAGLVFKLSHLADGMSTADFPPTPQQIAVHEGYQIRIAELSSRLDNLYAADVAAFNAMLRDEGVSYLSDVPEPSEKETP